MKRQFYPIIFLSAIFLFGLTIIGFIGCGGGGDGADTSQKLTGLYFLIDDYHDQDGDNLSGNLSEMKQAIENAGGSIAAITSAITASTLSSGDVLIIYDYESSFSSSEISSILNWLQQGGRLLVVGASRFANDGGATLDSILNPHGVSFGAEISANVLNTFVTHPITSGISNISVGEDFTIINGGTAIGSYNGFTGLAYTMNSPRIGVIGSSKVLDNSYFGGRDESVFLINSLSWLASGLSGSDVSGSGSGEIKTSTINNFDYFSFSSGSKESSNGDFQYRAFDFANIDPSATIMTTIEISASYGDNYQDFVSWTNSQTFFPSEWHGGQTVYSSDYDIRGKYTKWIKTRDSKYAAIFVESADINGMTFKWVYPYSNKTATWDPNETCRDIDGDGYYAQDYCGTAVDCDDWSASVNPGTTEICMNYTDNDCDGKIDCEDSDCSNNSRCK